MENMLMICSTAANDFAVWVCAHCETNNHGDTKLCLVCDMGRWTSCDVECEHSFPRPASVCVVVDLEDRNEPIVQVPLPYMTIYQVPANYKELMDAEREGALQLIMRLV
jgi:hypothetical protein